jgi:hypothetical protein
LLYPDGLTRYPSRPQTRKARHVIGEVEILALTRCEVTHRVRELRARQDVERQRFKDE